MVDRNTHGPSPLPQAPLEAQLLTEDTRVWQRDLSVDTMRVWAMSFAPATFRRTEELIAESDPETYNVVLLCAGRLERRWNGDDHASYAPGEFHVNDSSRPFELSGAGAGLIACLGVEVPKVLVPVPPEHAELLDGQALSGQSGLGGLLASVLRAITGEHGSFRATDAPHLGAVLRDLLAGVFAQAVDNGGGRVPAEVQRRNLLLHMRSFIDRRLHDPVLGPTTIAAAHHVSTSYVHKLFAGAGTTVTTWIRARRLEHARRDLSDPAMAAVPVHHIATRWGFAHHSTFTRAFRSAYGMAPRDFRDGLRVLSP